MWNRITYNIPEVDVTMFTAQYESSLDFFLVVKGPGTAMIGIYIVTQASRFPFL